MSHYSTIGLQCLPVDCVNRQSVDGCCCYIIRCILYGPTWLDPLDPTKVFQQHWLENKQTILQGSERRRRFLQSNLKAQFQIPTE